MECSTPHAPNKGEVFEVGQPCPCAIEHGSQDVWMDAPTASPKARSVGREHSSHTAVRTVSSAQFCGAAMP
eukprot:181126-Pelagomonas_calceolata.AAC.3